MTSPESSPREKAGLTTGLQPAPIGRRTWRSRPAIICMSILAVIWFLRHAITRHDNVNWPYSHVGDRPANVLEDDGWVDWDAIEPSEKLVWHPCYSIMGYPLRCARLTVPMDYHRPLDESVGNPKVHLALVLSPAPGRTEDPGTYGQSPLVLNPGGPGGSGALFAATGAPMIRKIVGPDHDILGFDPRGVGATTPKADCFEAGDYPWGPGPRKTSLMNRLTFTYSGHDVGLINSSNVALAKNDVRSRAVAQLCKQASDTYGNNSIFEYSNTANVARDMLSIIEAWEDWRLESYAAAKPPKSGQGADVAHPISQLNQAKTGSDSIHDLRGKLVYWGFSYGTLLGATFAAMFPDKVGRIILDGVVDADHYVEPVWMDSIADADKILDKFFVYCHAAGPKCSFFRTSDTPEDIKTRYYGLMTSLQEEPKIVFYPGFNIPVILTASDIKTVVFAGLYTPITSFPTIADLLNAILTDEKHLYLFVTPPALPAFCGNISLPLWPDDALVTVMCSDKRYKLNETLPELQKRFEKLALSSTFADLWLGLMMGCNGWDIKVKDPPMRWDDHPAHKPTPIETDFPVLFLSSKLDPVTPLRSALKMTRKFVNASIVEQDAEGHCTLACTSLCIIKHVRAYFNEGKLPPSPKLDSSNSGEWATCECEEEPWKQILPSEATAWSGEGDGLDADLVQAKTAEEVEWMRSWSDLRQEFVSQFMHPYVDENFVLRRAMKGLPGASLRTHQSRCDTQG